MNDPRQDSLADHLQWLEHLPRGWQNIFVQAAEKLAFRYPDVRIEQAKEKFGRLRIYLGRSPQEASTVVADAEHLSRSACEECGAAASLMVNDMGRFRTLCGSHSSGFKPPQPR